MAQPNDDKQQIIELTAALRQLEQQAKKATDALEKLHNTGPKSGKGPKKGKGAGLSPDELKADKIRTAQMSAMGLALGAVKTIAHAVKKFADHFNKVSTDFVKSTQTTTYSVSNTGIYKQAAVRARNERMADIYEKVYNLHTANQTNIADVANAAKEWSHKFAVAGNSVDEANYALQQFNLTIRKANENMTQMAGIAKGLSVSESTAIAQGLEAVGVQWLADNTFKGQLREGGLDNPENQAYILDSEEYAQLYSQLQNLVFEGGNAGPFTSSGFEGWAYKKGLYIPGVEYSESALSNARYDYLLEQWTTQKNYGTTGLAALIDDSKKQTMILNHIGGSLASFDEVEQVSAFSTADTLEEAKKEVSESKLTNEKLDEQIEQWAKQYNLTDKEKQILTDLYNQGFSLTALQNMLDTNLNLDEVYNALQDFLKKGGTIEEAEAQLALALADFPTEIKLTIPKDAKVKLDVSNLDALKEGLGKVPGSAVLADTPEGGNAFLEQLVNSGYLDAYTASEMTRFGWTKSEIEKWYLDYVKTYGTAPQLDPEKNEEFKKEAVPGNLYNYYKKQKVLSNNNKSDLSTNTYFTSYTDAKNGLGTTDLANYTNFPSLNPMADSSLYTSFITATIQAASTDLETESGAQGTGNTFIFNLNGSVYGGDKRIPLEFARQMNDALIDYNKKKGT